MDKYYMESNEVAKPFQSKRRGIQPDKLCVELFLLDPEKNITNITKISKDIRPGYGAPPSDFLNEDGKVEFPFSMTTEEFKAKLVEIYPKLNNVEYSLMKADKIDTSSYNPKDIYNSNLGRGKLYIQCEEEQHQEEQLQLLPHQQQQQQPEQLLQKLQYEQQSVHSSLGSSYVLQNESMRNITSPFTPSFTRPFPPTPFFSAASQADMSRCSPLNTLADGTVGQGPMNQELMENEGSEEDASSSDEELIPMTLSRSVNKLDTWRKMSENEVPVSGSVVNEPAKLSEAKASEQIKHEQRSVWELDRKLTKPETMFAQLAVDDSLQPSSFSPPRSANFKCTNAECRKREQEINRLKRELNEVKIKLQESEKKGHKKTNFIRLLLNKKQGLEKKIKNFETEQVLEHDVADGAKLLERLKLKEEDERGNSTHPLASHFVSPFNCDSSCVLSVVFFIFYEMNINICDRWFPVKMRIALGERRDDSIEVGECSWSFKDLHTLGLIEKPIFLKKNIKRDEIDNALKDVKTKMQTEKYPALLVVKYGKPSMPRHCLVIMPTTDDSEHVEIYDVQKNEQWKMNSNKVKSITEIELYKIDEKEAKAWEFAYSSTANCEVNVGRNSDGLD